MAALAGILVDDGHEVRGNDIDHIVFTSDILKKRNITIDVLLEDSDIPSDTDFVIVGHSFINHPIIDKIKSKNIPYKEYNHFIHDYFSSLYQVAICGTHGKTSTVGYFHHAISKILGCSMLRGDGVGIGGFANNMIVYEACEYYEHFLTYYPNTIIITNIDYDHVDYFKTKRQYNSAFNKFCKHANKVIVNYDYRNKIHHHNLLTYGVSENADYYFKNLDLTHGIKAYVYYKKEKIYHLDVAIFGLYNALHLLSVIAFLHSSNLDIEKAFKNFNDIFCINRRMQHKIIARDVFIDDYAHHPSEILASLEIAREMYPSHRVVGIFKPDRYSRLVKFQREFKKVLLNFDKAYILPIYEAVEANTKLLNADTRISYVDTLSELKSEEKEESNTVYLFMSSKNIDDWIYGLADFKSEIL